MRILLIVGLVILAGCSTSSGPRTVGWDVVGVHPSGAPEPTLSNEQLVLSARAVRTANLYTAPVTLECEFHPEHMLSNDSFFVDLVPADSPIVDLAPRYLSIKITADQTMLEVWESNLEQPGRLIASTAVGVETEGHYKLKVEIQGSYLVVHLNGKTLKVDQAAPPDKFRVELRTFPPPSSWRVEDFAIH